MNWATNIMNWQQRNREREEAIAMALKNRAEQKLGSTDIRGTRTHFVPGRGWVTEAAPAVKEMMDLQDAEQKRVLTYDLPQQRKERDRQYAQRLAEGGNADTLRRMFVTALTAPEATDDAIAYDLFKGQTQALREASADAQKRAWTQAFRTGQNSNFDDVASGLARESNKAYADAMLKAKMASRGIGAKEKQAKVAALASLYNTFATRAGQTPDIKYNPQQDNSQNLLAQNMQGALSAGGLAAQMFGKQGGTIDYIQPNLALGNGIAAAGSAFGSMFNNMGAKKAYQDSGSGGGFGISGFGTGGGDSQQNMYLGNEAGWEGMGG